jgi:hypothetical protein
MPLLGRCNSIVYDFVAMDQTPSTLKSLQSSMPLYHLWEFKEPSMGMYRTIYGTSKSLTVNGENGMQKSGQVVLCWLCLSVICWTLGEKEEIFSAYFYQFDRKVLAAGDGSIPSSMRLRQ